MIEPAADLLAELYTLSDRLYTADGLETILNEVLTAAMRLTDSEMGNIGIYNSKDDSLNVLAFQGFSREYVEQMSKQRTPVKGGPSEQAFATRRRVIVEDVHEHPAFQPFLPVVALAGFISMQATPILSREGEPIGTICTYRRQRSTPGREQLDLLDLYGRLTADAIERERAESSLRQSEERFRHLHALSVRLSAIDDWEELLADVLASVIELVGADSGILRLTGDTDGAMPFVTRQGLHDWFIEYFASVPPELDAYAPTRFAISARQPVIIEDVLSHPRFRPHVDIMRRAGYRSAIAIPLISQSKGPVGAICTYFHETVKLDPERIQIIELYARLASNSIERLAYAVDIASKEQALRQALSTKDHFLGMVSHELRTPMTMIRGLASVLRRNKRLRKDVLKEIYHDLGDASERLYRLIENMLILARLEVGQAPATELLLADKLVSTAADSLRNEMPNLHLEVGALPADVITLGNGQYFFQVLRNLVENAQKYSEAGAAVEIDVAVEAEEVIISILDRGIGLKNPEEIFQPFRREADAEQVAPGSGLGLAVCKTLLDAQSGRIWAEARPGGGSIFRFTLPRALESSLLP